MAITRAKFTLEFRIEAAHHVIDTGQSVRSFHNSRLIRTGHQNGVRDERRRMEALAGASGEPPSPTKRAELVKCFQCACVAK